MPLDPMIASDGMTAAISKAAALSKYKTVNGTEYEIHGEFSSPDKGTILALMLDDVWYMHHIEEDDEMTSIIMNNLGDKASFLTALNQELTTPVTEADLLPTLKPVYGASADTGTFPVDFATAYDDYATTGLVLGATNVGGAKDIISDFLDSAKSAGVANVTMFATALASYWATVALVPGPPMHGGTATVSVVNDASAHVSDFEAAILASMTTTESKPYYLNFINNIQTMAVAKIIWTVTELIPTPGGPVPTPFPETIT